MVELHGARAFFMPGVPREMKRMFDEEMVPRIRELSPNDSHQIRYRTFGLPESVVGEKLAGVEAAFSGVTIGYRARFPEIEVKVLARAADRAAAVDLAERAAAEVQYPPRRGDLRQRRGHLRRRRRSRPSGLVAGRSRSPSRAPAGSSAISSRRSRALPTTCSSTRSPTRTPPKQAVLGVDEDALRGHGAVSAEVATRMADGARRVSGADVALAITGIAGPTRRDRHEAGRSCLPRRVSTAKGTVVKEQNFPGERHWIQTLAAYAGLSMVRAVCKNV